MNTQHQSPSSIPTLETKRLRLTPISINDEQDYQKYFSDYEVIRNLSAGVPWPYPEDGVKTFLTTVILPNQGKDRWTWALRLKENPTELIGCVDLWREGKPEHRGFWLGRKFWGKGYMTEAVQPIIDYAFDVLGFKELIFANAIANKKSRRIKEKTGAKFIGTSPASFVDPNYKEQELWSLQRDAWLEYRNRQKKSDLS